MLKTLFHFFITNLTIDCDEVAVRSCLRLPRFFVVNYRYGNLPYELQGSQPHPYSNLNKSELRSQSIFGRYSRRESPFRFEEVAYILLEQYRSAFGLGCQATRPLCNDGNSTNSTWAVGLYSFI